jgi:hypothetical protein
LVCEKKVCSGVVMFERIVLRYSKKVRGRCFVVNMIDCKYYEKSTFIVNNFNCI